MAQVEHLLLVEIDDAARRADQDVGALLELPPLLVVVHAAEHAGDLQARVLAQRQRIVVDLHGQLAGRRDDDAADGRHRALFLARHVGQQRLEHRHQEGGGLAGAGLGLAGDVPSGQRKGQRLRLDGRAAHETRRR